MCVLKDFWGKGIGFTIMGMIIDEARKMGYEQVELEVVADNIRAFSLYKKFGFEIYGVRKNSFKYRDGRYSSEYLMALPL
jgi:ribosomal protein S18 acetylase RimI-like enzyme